MQPLPTTPGTVYLFEHEAGSEGSPGDSEPTHSVGVEAQPGDRGEASGGVVALWGTLRGSAAQCNLQQRKAKKTEKGCTFSFSLRLKSFTLSGLSFTHTCTHTHSGGLELSFAPWREWGGGGD